MPLFYFHGVNGAVPANRHKNPDGSLGGGWQIRLLSVLAFM